MGASCGRCADCDVKWKDRYEVPMYHSGEKRPRETEDVIVDINHHNTAERKTSMQENYNENCDGYETEKKESVDKSPVKCHEEERTNENVRQEISREEQHVQVQSKKKEVNEPEELKEKHDEEIKNSSSNIEDLEKDERLKGEIGRLEDQVEHLQGEIEHLKDENRHLIGENEDLKDEKEHLIDDVKRLEEQVEHLKGEIEDLKGENKHLLDEKGDLEGENGQLKGKVKRLEDEVVRLNGKVAMLQHDVQDLKIRLDEKEEEKGRLALGQMCSNLQKNFYQYVFYTHNFSESTQSYYESDIEKDIEKGRYGLNTKQKRKEARDRWSTLKKDLGWDGDDHVRGIKQLMNNRNLIAHPEDIGEKETLERMAHDLHMKNELDEVLFGIVMKLIDMWSKTNDLVKKKQEDEEKRV